jgi:hypothetical protein
MRILFYIICIVSLAFVSCDGRDKSYKTNQEVLKEHKLFKSFSEKITYIPENYLETTTDTILSNGFQVKIKSYTDMNSSVLKEYSQDNLQYKKYYRDIKTSISIVKNNQEITSTTITKELFNDYNKSSKTNRNKIIQGVWLNQYSSTIYNKVILNVQLYEPETKHHEHYTLEFDEQGTLSINNQEIG